jgi:hypothetical protein
MAPRKPKARVVASAQDSSMTPVASARVVDDADYHMNILFKIARAVYGDGQERQRKCTYAVISDLLKTRETWSVEQNPTTRPMLSIFLRSKSNVYAAYAAARPTTLSILDTLYTWAAEKVQVPVIRRKHENSRSRCSSSDVAESASSHAIEPKVGAITAATLKTCNYVDIDIPQGCRSLRIVFNVM